MARKKSADTLDAEIAKVKSDMSKLQDRYDRLAEKLKDLQAPDRGGCNHGRVPEKWQNTRRDHDIFEALGLLV